MTEKDTHTGYSGPMGLKKVTDRGLCPKCQTPSVIEDMGDLAQCQSCGLYMGNNLKNEILETRQTIIAREAIFDDENKFL